MSALSELRRWKAKRTRRPVRQCATLTRLCDQGYTRFVDANGNEAWMHADRGQLAIKIGVPTRGASYVEEVVFYRRTIDYGGGVTVVEYHEGGAAPLGCCRLSAWRARKRGPDLIREIRGCVQI